MALQSVQNQPDDPAYEPAAKRAKIDDMAAAPAPASRKEFEAVFPKLVEDVTEHVKQYNIPDNALEWFRTVWNLLNSPISSLSSLQLDTLSKC